MLQLFGMLVVHASLLLVVGVETAHGNALQDSLSVGWIV